MTMTDDSFDLGIGPARERLERLSRRAEDLPADARELVNEILEAFAASVEELQMAVEELHRQNQELLTTQEKAEAGRRRYRDLFQFAPDGYLVTDPAGQIHDANQAAMDLLGVIRAELIGQPLALYVAPGERDRFHVHLDRQAEGHGAGVGEVEWEMRFQPRRGPAFTAALTVTPVRDVRGERTGLRWLLRDVTASKRAEERERLLANIQQLAVSLEQERELQQTIVDNTASHLAYFDPEFNYIRVNAAYAQGTGHCVEELIGRNHFELFPHSENRAVFERVRDTGEPARFWAMPIHFPEQPERGTTYWDWSMVPVKDEQGEVQGLVISSTEVTERVQLRRERQRLQKELERHAEKLEKSVARRTAALRASEARFRTIFEDSVIGIALLDTEGRLVASNPALQDILGYSEEELASMTFSGYSHPDDAEADKDLYQALTSGELGYYQVEKRFVRQDGQVRWGQVTISRIKGPKGGKPWLAVAAMEDITEKKRTQEALLQAERLSIAGRLGASLAHEINNPLQSVIGCLGLAEEMLDDGGEVRRYLEIAMEELERAAGIVTQLRDLNRESEPGAGKPTDLNTLMETVLTLIRKQCQDRNIAAEWAAAADLPAVRLVPERMQQVFLNLVLNAIEAMPGGGRLHMSATPTSQPEGVRITFADDGVGMEPDNLSRIFEPFHSTRPEGLGLGLYVSKKIVEQHGGRIEVDSHVGEGTTFTVWLPR